MKLKDKYITLTPSNRLLNESRPIIAITGSIATGKTTVSTILQRQYSIPIVCADSIIKQIYKSLQTVAFIKTLAPTTIEDQQIDFTKLRSLFFNDNALKQKIEQYLFSQYPNYLKKRFQEININFIIYDIPLLFEKQLQNQVDQAVCVYTPSEIQTRRIIKRDNCSIKTAQQIISAQLPIEQKRKLATYVIDNSTSLEDLQQEVSFFVKDFFIDS
jgi:dephospho-CoA kinase